MDIYLPSLELGVLRNIVGRRKERPVYIHFLVTLEEQATTGLFQLQELLAGPEYCPTTLRDQERQMPEGETYLQLTSVAWGLLENRRNLNLCILSEVVF